MARVQKKRCNGRTPDRDEGKRLVMGVRCPNDAVYVALPGPRRLCEEHGRVWVAKGGYLEPLVR